MNWGNDDETQPDRPGVLQEGTGADPSGQAHAHHAFRHARHPDDHFRRGHFHRDPQYQTGGGLCAQRLPDGAGGPTMLQLPVVRAGQAGRRDGPLSDDPIGEGGRGADRAGEGADPWGGDGPFDGLRAGWR